MRKETFYTMKAALMIVIILIFCFCIEFIEGHGRLLEPPGRSTLWRFGFSAPVNYNDNQLFCGGFGVQWSGNNGKCGICGDRYDQPEPRDNEAGGKYGRGIISRVYRAGSKVTVTVQLTSNHKGWFEFRICPNNNTRKDPKQECLDKYLLKLANGSGTRYFIPGSFPSSGTVNLNLQLPENVTCSQCVFQWHYNTGNSWGVCEDGKQQLGCGRQETYRACADIRIIT